jgi:outer membrane protein assembly factor BamB
MMKCGSSLKMLGVSWLSLLAGGDAVLGQDWAEFRGPRGDGQAYVKSAPLAWSAEENIAWKTEIPGQGWSSPSLSEGKIYLTTAVVTQGKEEDAKADRSLRALCVDAATGKIDWNVEVFPQVGATAPASIHKKNGHASPTPLVRDGVVYVHFGHQGTAALDLSGKTLWTNRKYPYSPQHGNGPSPVLFSGKLMFNADATDKPFLVALDAATGQEVWKVDRPETAQKQKFSFANPVIVNLHAQPQLLSPGAGALDAFDPADGKHLWRVDYEGYSVVPGVVVDDNLLFFTTAYDTPDVYCVNPYIAKGNITEKGVVWTNGKSAPCTVALTVVGKEIYWVADGGGMVTCANKANGEIYWRERTGLGNCSASPVVAAGHLYITDEQGQTLILKPGQKYEKVALNSLGERTLASLAVTEGTLIQRTEGHLWRIGKK